MKIETTHQSGPIEGRCGLPLGPGAWCRRWPVKGKNRCGDHSSAEGAPRANESAVTHGAHRDPRMVLGSMSPERRAALDSIDDGQLDQAGDLAMRLVLSQLDDLEARYAAGKVSREAYETGVGLYAETLRRHHASRADVRAKLSRAGLDDAAKRVVEKHRVGIMHVLSQLPGVVVAPEDVEGE